MRITSSASLWAAAIVGLALAGCSGKASSGAPDASATAAGSAATTTSSDSKIKPYSGWAAAVAPNYTGNVLSAGGISDRLYQIDSADDYDTVLTWYKAHVKTNWPAPDPDTPQDQTVVTVGKVQITVQKNSYWKSADQPKSMIAFLRQD